MHKNGMSCTDNLFCSHLEQLAEDITIFLLSALATSIFSNKVLNACRYPGVMSLNGKDFSIGKCGASGGLNPEKILSIVRDPEFKTQSKLLIRP